MSGEVRQQTATVWLQGGPGPTVGATTNGNGTIIETDGWNGAIMLEVLELAGGTFTVNFQGTYDRLTYGGATNDTRQAASHANSNWYNVGYYQVDNNATLTRTVGTINFTANLKHVYQVLDLYPCMRAVITNIAAGGSAFVRAYQCPA